MAQSGLLAELARFVERISAIARTGLAFKPSGFDAERYEDLLKEAARMHAHIAGAGETEAEEIRRTWREQVLAGYEGYVTAAVGCGVIAFNERDEILMIQRPTGRWWYPTGFCEVGVSPAENAAKEALEETGLIVSPERLIAVFDNKKSGSTARHIYTVLFYCRIAGGELAPNPLEALTAGFFPLDQLPEPLHGLDRKWISLAREFHFDGRIEPYFDPL
ncbi:MAG TPA: NUDIX hydrolase N-terminal domain-containing protein [Candidatus Binataceae bacterium]|nr:NUDIX hydrolase N-terminal domain-containing protein [Candidatus Binataceae bacterium]